MPVDEASISESHMIIIYFSSEGEDTISDTSGKELINL